MKIRLRKSWKGGAVRIGTQIIYGLQVYEVNMEDPLIQKSVTFFKAKGAIKEVSEITEPDKMPEAPTAPKEDKKKSNGGKSKQKTKAATKANTAKDGYTPSSKNWKGSEKQGEPEADATAPAGESKPESEQA